ncbi:Threonine/homoserine/homoserine lactone efflux protein [Flavobacterium succinicans]|jgi:threonine/homoserine/homoserine lactone efflux protein|uniref:Threonine/homoserine/homoserine lactone efflux protein n=1 Tax=Flavobacterium succinicans TaxID=29536 RepID=A0A1I4UXG4_9FLAO|nr:MULTISPECIES: LysE family transporter [Flavobacterium]OOV28431.1 lysine transporter LysE [Flavobacterium sp. LM5]SFM93652.1 Threonine/homoserine/homoserine lactone efflux protein [Flavobacterium succinicans]
MHIVGLFFLGFISAFVGISPPGLINMTAVKVNLKEGKRTAMWFVLGAVLVIFIQTFLALLFARVLDKSPALLLLFREIGCVIFALLTVYFLLVAKKPKIKEGNIKKYSKKSRFFLGILLSALNFFPIPYYVLLGITFASYHLFSFDITSILIFVLGVVSGAFMVFYGYVFFFNKIEAKAGFFLQNMNTLIGSVTGIMTLLTLYNIMDSYGLF